MWGVQCLYVPWSKILSCGPCPHKIGFLRHCFVAWHLDFRPTDTSEWSHLPYSVSYDTWNRSYNLWTSPTLNDPEVEWLTVGILYPTCRAGVCIISCSTLVCDMWNCVALWIAFQILACCITSTLHTSYLFCNLK